ASGTTLEFNGTQSQAGLLLGESNTGKMIFLLPGADHVPGLDFTGARVLLYEPKILGKVRRRLRSDHLRLSMSRHFPLATGSAEDRERFFAGYPALRPD